MPDERQEYRTCLTKHLTEAVMADDFKYHIEQHGSLVRPPALLIARASGTSGDALTAAEEEAVAGVAHLQRRTHRNSADAVIAPRSTPVNVVPGCYVGAREPYRSPVCPRGGAAGRRAPAA